MIGVDKYEQVVDGGESHLRESALPYPQAVLDPEGVKALIQGKK